jgi:hypothetical protein
MKRESIMNPNDAHVFLDDIAEPIDQSTQEIPTATVRSRVQRFIARHPRATTASGVVAVILAFLVLFAAITAAGVGAAWARRQAIPAGASDAPATGWLYIAPGGDKAVWIQLQLYADPAHVPTGHQGVIVYWIERDRCPAKTLPGATCSASMQLDGYFADDAHTIIETSYYDASGVRHGVVFHLSQTWSGGATAGGDISYSEIGWTGSWTFHAANQAAEAAAFTGVK